MIRPHIPKKTQTLLWLKAGGRCEFRGCNKILYEDNVTKDPINESNIAHIISWQASGPRGDASLSSSLATDINNLMLTCPEHNHLIDYGENVKKFTVSFLQDMKKEHEDRIRCLTGLGVQPPNRIIELKSKIHDQRPSISFKDESDALFPFYPHSEKIVIDVCDIDDLEASKKYIDAKVKNNILSDREDGLYAAFIMAEIPISCCLGYAIGNKVKVKTYQHFHDTQDWKWRDHGEDYEVVIPKDESSSDNVNLFVNISGTIDSSLVDADYPTYKISAKTPSIYFLQSWDQVEDFRQKYRFVLDMIREKHGESSTIHLFLATPNPINFEIGSSIMKNIDPTIILYDKTDDTTKYKEVMFLHKRVRVDGLI